MKPSFSKLSLLALPVFALTACQDYEPFDEAEVHATMAAREFSKDFSTMFGEVNPNHKWGFDLAEFFLVSEKSAQTRGVYKQEMNIEVSPGDYVKTTSLYSKPDDITENEKIEVYAWFSNHTVTWVTTPTYYNGTPTNQTTNNIAKVNSTDYAAAGYGTLLNHSAENTFGDYTINSVIHFHNGWVQHVNANYNVETVYMYPTGAADEDTYKTHQGYPDNLTKDVNKADMMNYLYSWGLTADGTGDWQVHLYDFNKGYGYCNPSFDGTDNSFSSKSQNAILITDADINTWTYDCSNGNSLKHDKYYLVYLKGDDYEGWYLGFDFESWGNNTNERVKADGICNDWIIKLSDAGATPFNPSRIMCEDLGGTFDMDYNDIVFDVAFQNNIATITMKAAGGTIPIELYYGVKGKGGTLLTKNVGGSTVSEIHELYGVPVDTPINVRAPKGQDNKDDIVWHLGFKNETYYNGSPVDFSFSSNFDFQMINIYVYHNSIAEWVNLSNIDGAAPYKICVPNSVKWTQESQTIDWAYKSFRTWVANPTFLFWNDSPNINSSLLY